MVIEYQSLGFGKVKVVTKQSEGEKVVGWITNVSYVPKLTNDLSSVHAATSKGNTGLFRHKDYCIKN